MASDTDTIIRDIRQQGWRVERGSRHYRAYPPDGGRMLTISVTQGDRHRGIDNLKADLRREGAKLK